MTRYIALIRGINVGGKNTVSMARLKEVLLAYGFENVVSYINSGNIIFDSQDGNLANLITVFESLLRDEFAVTTRVAILPAAEVHDAFANAPLWWGKDLESKHNALFIIAPARAEEIAYEVGDAKPEYEKVATYGRVIFWSAPLVTFSRTRWSKIVGTNSYDKITIRNFNTTKKLVELTS